MNSHKILRIKCGFQARYSLLLQMLLALAGERDVVILCFRVIQFGNRNNVDACSVFYNNAFGILTRTASCCDKLLWPERHGPANPLFSSIQGGFKPLRTKGLHQIINRVDLKSTQRMFVVGGHENYSDVCSD